MDDQGEVVATGRDVLVNGDVDVDGEITARSLHVVNTDGDTLINFKADGTSYHKGKETFEGGLMVPIEGDWVIRINRETGFTIGDSTQSWSYIQFCPMGDGLVAGTLLVYNLSVYGDKSFQIDHPLDPANKYLVHSSIESSERLNLYSGNVVTDEDGYAAVRLPSWFEALNHDVRYQLTVIGQFAQAIVAQEILDGEFVIRTDKPSVKVSWQVAGVRHDPWARANPLCAEPDKLGDDRGRYVHPEAFGLTASHRIGAQQAP